MNKRVEVQRPVELGMCIALGFIIVPMLIVGVIVFGMIVLPICLFVLSIAIAWITSLPNWVLYILAGSVVLAVILLMGKLHQASEVKRAQRMCKILEAVERRS